MTTIMVDEGLTTAEVLDLIFKDPSIKHGLTEFEDLGQKPHEILSIYPKISNGGRGQPETRYYLKCFKRQQELQVYSEKQSSQEEIVCQLWLYTNNLGKFLIPAFDRKIQNEVGDKVRPSYAALKDSRSLLEQAIVSVESLVGQEANI